LDYIFLSFYFKLGPKHMNLSLCPNLLGLKRTLKFLEMAALFHIHNCHRWVLFTPTCFLLFCLNVPLTTTPPRRKSLNLLLVQILQLLRWWFCCSNFLKGWKRRNLQHCCWTTKIARKALVEVSCFLSPCCYNQINHRKKWGIHL
jgi:hypothetical protein